MAKVKRKVRRNNRKADWENETKEQMSLLPGSPEYRERVEDLKMHDPFRPDDAWHNELEERNEEHHNPEKPNAVKQTDTDRWKNIRRQFKRSQFNETKQLAKEEAEKTESKKDDKRVAGMKRKDLDEYVFDDGVNEEEYVNKTLRKYID